MAVASLGHIAVGMVAARLDGGEPRSRGALALSMLAWSALSLLPDADVIGFRFGVEYGDPWGHRGATHSLAFSALGGAAIGLVAAARGGNGRRIGALAALVLASHGLLDALTNGGLGCALLWPFSDARIFVPWRPLPVAPIGRHYLSSEGLAVALREVVVFAPLFAFALWPRARSRNS
jgi:inner membrane protein